MAIFDKTEERVRSLFLPLSFSLSHLLSHTTLVAPVVTPVTVIARIALNKDQTYYTYFPVLLQLSDSKS